MFRRAQDPGAQDMEGPVSDVRIQDDHAETAALSLPPEVQATPDQDVASGADEEAGAAAEPAAEGVSEEAAASEAAVSKVGIEIAAEPAEDAEPADAEAHVTEPDPLEALRAAVITGCERLNQASQGADADFIRGQLEELRARVMTVRPADLTPRSGLGGLFDSRKKRLARFRDHVTDLAPSISTAAVKLRDAAAELTRRNGTLNELHQGLLNAVAELDEALMAFPERADSTRDEGLKHLPLTRMIQNVDARLAQTAGQVAGAAMEWRDDLLRALGADGKKLAPLRRVQPDQDVLNRACEGLLSGIDQAEAALTAAAARRDEVLQRLGRTLAAARGEAV